MSAGVLPAPPRPAPPPALLSRVCWGLQEVWAVVGQEVRGQESVQARNHPPPRLSVTITQPSNTQQPLLSSVLTSNSIQHNPIFPD